MKSYEALPFLNNVGITLLERRQFKESVQTFADAVVLHRSTITALQKSDDGSLNKSDDETQKTLDELLTQEALRRASTRLAQVQVKTSNDMGYLALDPFMVLDLANASCMSSILQFGTDIDQIDFVVRMNQEADNDFVSDNTRKVKIDSAILFLNYGVACKRASSMIEYSSDENVRNDLREQSKQLFNLSNQIIQIEIECLYNARHNKEILIVEHYLEIALMISMFTSAHISECMYWQQDSIEDDGNKYYLNFEQSFKSFRTISTEKIGSLSKAHAASA